MGFSTMTSHLLVVLNRSVAGKPLMSSPKSGLDTSWDPGILGSISLCASLSVSLFVSSPLFFYSSEILFWKNWGPPLCLCRWWASSVTPAAFPHSRNMTSPFHRSTAPWMPLHPTPSQLAAATVRLRLPSRRWIASHHLSPTVHPHTAPPVTAWTRLWQLLGTSTASMARVSPTSPDQPIATAPPRPAARPPQTHTHSSFGWTEWSLGLGLHINIFRTSLQSQGFKKILEHTRLINSKGQHLFYVTLLNPYNINPFFIEFFSKNLSYAVCYMVVLIFSSSNCSSTFLLLAWHQWLCVIRVGERIQMIDNGDMIHLNCIP